METPCPGHCGILLCAQAGHGSALRPMTTLYQVGGRPCRTAREPVFALEKRMVGILTPSFSAPLVTEKDGACHLFAEKVPWSRPTACAMHLSMRVILIGAVTGALFGFQGLAAGATYPLSVATQPV